MIKIKKFLQSLFHSNQVPRTHQYGIVLITKEPEKESSLFQKEINSIMSNPHIVKSYELSMEEVNKMVPQLSIVHSPTFIVIREGIDSTQSLSHRLEHSVLISNKITEVILFIELLKQQN